MPSTMSVSVSRLLASSTVITPSLPTFCIALAISSPMKRSPLAEILPIWAISSDIALSRCRLVGLLDSSLDLETQRRDQSKAPDDILRLTAPASLKRVGREMRMLVENVDRAVQFSML